MEHFGHFFEFIAALNSAYIVSNHFLESLVGKINNHFSNTRGDLKLITELHKNNSDWLISEADKCVGNESAQQTLKALEKDNGVNEEEIKALETELAEAERKNSISKNFNYLCLFGALYSILILILNGFGVDVSKDPYTVLFGTFNVICLIALLTIINEIKIIKWRIRSSYNKILMIFPINIAFIYPAFYYIQEWLFQPTTYGRFWIIFNVCISILLPTSHFLYYSIKTSTKTKKQAKELKSKSECLKQKCENFSREIKGAIGALGNFLGK